MSTRAPQRSEVTGLVLAGGRGSRMGGIDKGLQPLDGRPLVQHALERLAPQVGALMISANRHLEAYSGYGVPVLPDAHADYAGPLAGMLAGLERAATEWLVTVPCDSPRFPLDLVARLAAGLGAAPAAVALSAQQGVMRREPVFCLLRCALKHDLAAALAAGERKIERWLARVGCADVAFDDAQAFANANTPDELDRLRAG